MMNKFRNFLNIFLVSLAIIFLLGCLMKMKLLLEFLTAIGTVGAFVSVIWLHFHKEKSDKLSLKKGIKSLVTMELFTAFQLLLGQTKELEFELVGERKLKENSHLFNKIDEDFSNENIFELYVHLRNYMYFWRHEFKYSGDKNGKFSTKQVVEKKYQIISFFINFLELPDDPDYLDELKRIINGHKQLNQFCEELFRENPSLKTLQKDEFIKTILKGYSLNNQYHNALAEPIMEELVKTKYMKSISRKKFSRQIDKRIY